jgi:hypothetical protein
MAWALKSVPGECVRSGYTCSAFGAVMRSNTGRMVEAGHTRLHKKFRRYIEERVNAVIIRTPQAASPTMKRLAVHPNADRQIGHQALTGSCLLVEFHSVSKFHRE